MTADKLKVRIDKWLWAARFFKTRNQAGQAVAGGKVQINGKRVKPSRIVAIGDVLAITKNDTQFIVTVLGLNQYRRPAVEARLLYEESEESIKDREEHNEMRKLIRAPGISPSKRPDKRDRRKIRAFIRKG